MLSCQQKVKDKCSECGTESSLFFCLVLKDYLSTCPSSCPYFINGATNLCYSIKYFYQSNMEMECLYLHLITKNTQNSNDSSFFTCSVTGISPDCDHCPLKE